VEAPARREDRAPAREERAPAREDHDAEEGGRREKYARPSRTGREAGMTTLFMNVGRKQLVTPADIVGKIAGVTRLPADVVGAIDIHQRHVLVDVATEVADMVVKKLTGIRVKGQELVVTRAQEETDVGGDA
jgi:ATP-dependent RNA helicase DeaD